MRVAGLSIALYLLAVAAMIVGWLLVGFWGFIGVGAVTALIGYLYARR